MTEECVWDLAKAFPAARFVKLNFEEAQMEPAGVPAILAYRGGEKFAGLIPVLDEIPEDDELSPETLAEALRRFVSCSLIQIFQLTSLDTMFLSDAMTCQRVFHGC